MARLDDLRISYAVCGPDGLTDAERERDRYKNCLNTLVKGILKLNEYSRVPSWIVQQADDAQQLLDNPNENEVRNALENLEEIALIVETHDQRAALQAAADLIRRLVK